MEALSPGVWWQERNLQNYHATRLKLQKFFIIHFVAAVESSSEWDFCMNEQNVPFASLLLVQPKMDAVWERGVRRRGTLGAGCWGGDKGVLPKTNWKMCNGQMYSAQQQQHQPVMPKATSKTRRYFKKKCHRYPKTFAGIDLESQMLKRIKKINEKTMLLKYFHIKIIEKSSEMQPTCDFRPLKFTYFLIHFVIMLT